MTAFEINRGKVDSDGPFLNYEINSTVRWPIIVRLLVGSLVLHIICVLCVIYIPAVRDAVNVAAMFSGVHYVDSAYNKTQVGDRAQIITLPKFHYPEGYFAMFTEGAVAPVPAALPDGPPAQVVSQWTPPPVPKPMKPPRIRSSPTASAKSSSAGVSPSPTAPQSTPSQTVAKALTKEEQDKKTREDAEKELNRVAAETHIKRPREINKKPFTDWLAKARKMKEGGELNLEGTIDLTAEADRDAQGKLSNIEVKEKTGDPKLIGLAKELIAALGDSGALDFLEGTEHLTINVKLNETDVVATASTEMKSVDLASQMARGYSLALGIAGKIRQGHDEEAVYKNTKVSANGKVIILNFNMPRTLAGEILKRQNPAI